MTQTPSRSALADLPMGRIAATTPGATAVFRRHHLDYCCGGSQTLGDAAREGDLDLAQIERELGALKSGEALAPDESGALIDHILTRYHQTHRRELPELIALARKVEAVHAGHHHVPVGLAALLLEIATEIDAHMAKEEQDLFPMMRKGGNALIALPINLLRDEHDAHGERLRRLEALTGDHQAPADACSSWLALYAGTRKLVDDVMQHIHLENNVLFPRYAAA